MEATYGIVLVAVIFSAFLTGILTLQLTSYYALFPKDSMIRKSLVSEMKPLLENLFLIYIRLLEYSAQILNWYRGVINSLPS